jgi:hypothetical protein
MDAGAYSIPFVWSVYALGSADNFGEKPRGYTAGGTLWGTPAENVNANSEVKQQGEKQITRATIRVRNFPTVKPLDKLTDDLARVWRVVNTVRGDNEIICDVEIDT